MLEQIKEAIEQAGGKLDPTVTILPDGSGFATGTFPLPKDHWSKKKDIDDRIEEDAYPPMPFKMGTGEHALFTTSNATKAPRIYTREEVAEIIRTVGKYALRVSIYNDDEIGFDPDAYLQNLVVGFLGYWTANGLTSHEDDWGNPPEYRENKGQ